MRQPDALAVFDEWCDTGSIP